MPVSILFCEGKRTGADIQVVSRIIDVAGCTVQAGGSHRQLASRIRELADLCTVGLRDRDQHADSFTPTRCPPEWRDENMLLGWYWERVELENYLLDPEVVARTIAHDFANFDMAAYRQALADAAKSITDYAAARKAITDCLPVPFPPAQSTYSIG